MTLHKTAIQRVNVGMLLAITQAVLHYSEPSMKTLYDEQEFTRVLNESSSPLLMVFLEDIIDRRTVIKQLEDAHAVHLPGLRVILVSRQIATAWERFRITGQPTWVLVHNGQVVWRWLGKLDWNSLEKTLQDMRFSGSV